MQPFPEKINIPGHGIIVIGLVVVGVKAPGLTERAAVEHR